MATEHDHGAPDFGSWTPIVDAAVAFAGNYPEEFRGAIVQALLVGTPSQTQPSMNPTVGADQADVTNSPKERVGEALNRLAEALDASPDDLRRVVDIHPEEGIQILARLNDTTAAQLQNEYSAIHAFVNEIALGAADTPIEELRDLCEKHRCYNQPNFTRNFRTMAWLNEVTKSRTNKRYRLSRQGEAAARHLLEGLLGV